MALIRKMRVGDQIQTPCGTVLRVVEVRGKVVRVAVEIPGGDKCRLKVEEKSREPP